MPWVGVFIRSARNTTNDVGSASLVRTTGDAWFYDTGISLGVRYYYWVRVQNQYGYGDFSDSDWGYAGVPPAVLGLNGHQSLFHLLDSGNLGIARWRYLRNLA